MGRPQLVSYERLATLYIEAVELQLPPVRTLVEVLDGAVSYEILARRLESMRGRGWLPPGAPNGADWVPSARAVLAGKLAQSHAEAEARAQQEELAEKARARVRERHESERIEQQVQRTLRLQHERSVREAQRIEARQERADRRQSAKEQRRLEREATWRSRAQWESQLFDLIETGDPDACWPFTGRLDAQGYGRLNMQDGFAGGRRRFRPVGAHRAAWLVLRGPIGDGLTLDHQCHNRDLSCRGGPTCRHRRCCNPAHLEPVPSPLNTARADHQQRVRQHRTSCRNGHLYAEHGRLFQPRQGREHRVCDQCIADANERAAQRRRDEQAGVLDYFPGSAA